MDQLILPYCSMYEFHFLISFRSRIIMSSVLACCSLFLAKSSIVLGQAAFSSSCSSRDLVNARLLLARLRRASSGLMPAFFIREPIHWKLR